MDEGSTVLSEETRAVMRNYVMMAAFFIIFMWQLISAMYSYGNSVMPGIEYFDLDIICNTSLIILGVILAFLRKRDLYAVFFISLALFTFDIALVGAEIALPVDLLCLVLAVMYLLTRSEQKYIPALIYILISVLALRTFDSFPKELMTAVVFIIAMVSLYCAFAIGFERVKLPFRDLLTVDDEHPENDGEPIDFKVLGSSFGYIVFASVPLVLLYRSLAGLDAFVPVYFMVVSGAIMIVIALIMLLVSNLRQTPMIFIILGTFLMLMAYLYGMTFVQFLILLALGILVLMRRESRLLVALSLFCFAMVPLSVFIIGSGPITDLFEALTVVICIWISLGLHSNGRIPIR